MNFQYEIGRLLMGQRNAFYTLILGLTALAVGGCGNSEVEQPQAALPAWLTEEDEASQSIERQDLRIEGEADEQDRFTQTTRSPDVESPQHSLDPGDRFPLRKVVAQELTQSSPDGVPQISRSRLELQLVITVDDVKADRMRLTVRYDRVRYSHDVGGESVEYDSAAPPTDLPPAVLAYHGMVNDGFSFHLGRDNQIVGVIGFREFLDRCLQHVPADQRQRVMLDIQVNSGEKGIADFVDNTIGLLPPGVERAVGASWEKTRHIGRPIPMQINTVYMLTGLNDRTADISISGTITPSTTLGQSAANNQSVQIVVEGGSTQGHCMLFRNTGFPKESREERLVEMTVRLAAGMEFSQQKRTVTTVESFLPRSSSATAKTAAEPSGSHFQ